MSDLRIEGSAEQQFAIVKSEVIQMHGTIYGNGQDGLLSEFKELVTTLKATNIEREKQHAENRRRMNLVIALAGVIASLVLALIGLVTFFHTVEAPQSTKKVPAIYHSQTTDPALSWNSSPPQDACGWDTPHAKE